MINAISSSWTTTETLITFQFIEIRLKTLQILELSELGLMVSPANFKEIFKNILKKKLFIFFTEDKNMYIAPSYWIHLSKGPYSINYLNKLYFWKRLNTTHLRSLLSKRLIFFLCSDLTPRISYLLLLQREFPKILGSLKLRNSQLVLNAALLFTAENVRALFDSFS